MSDIEEFINNLSNLPLPTNPIARIKTFARELAEGVTQEHWDYNLPRAYHTIGNSGVIVFESELAGANIHQYLFKRWNNAYPELELLVHMGYLNQLDGNYQVTKKSFELITETPPSTIFISYKRSESSAFALLIVARLKEHNLNPFVDMLLRAGEEWHPALEKHIKLRDYFIVLVGKETLKSIITLREISWAIKCNKTIIPIWHNGFEFNQDEWPDVPTNIVEAIGRKHALKVFEESASGYNTAIVELLNQFEITP